MPNYKIKNYRLQGKNRNTLPQAEAGDALDLLWTPRILPALCCQTPLNRAGNNYRLGYDWQCPECGNKWEVKTQLGGLSQHPAYENKPEWGLHHYKQPAEWFHKIIDSNYGKNLAFPDKQLSFITAPHLTECRNATSKCGCYNNPLIDIRKDKPAWAVLAYPPKTDPLWQTYEKRQWNKNRTRPARREAKLQGRPFVETEDPLHPFPVIQTGIIQTLNI